MSNNSNENKGTVDLSIDESTGIATVCINNPKKRNAINGQMMEQFSHIITQLEKWQTGKAVIIFGKNGFFSSGVDLGFVGQHMKCVDTGYHYSRLMHSNLNRLKSLPLVSVAAIDGQALGGGAEICTACDIRLMTKNAKIGFVQIKVGVTPGWSGGTHLFHICGYTIALDLLMSGRILSAEEAINIGFINHLFNDFLQSEHLIEETKQWLTQNTSYDLIIDLKNNLSANRLSIL